MGSISVQIISTNNAIDANKKSGFYWWNNPSQNSVYNFSAVPTGGDNPPDTWYGLQVTDVDYAHIAAPGGMPGSKRRVRFKVNNPNPFKVTFEIHMSIASP